MLLWYLRWFCVDCYNKKLLLLIVFTLDIKGKNKICAV